MGKMMTKLFAKPLFDSKIKSANTEGKEKVWGYFVGPMFMCMAYYGIAGTYLTQFYTDVLGLSGVVLTMMPVFSKIFDAITNIIMGRIIDKTKTRQGKARPWILISGVLIMLTGIMLYNVPRASQSVQLVWIVISYNLFFAFAYTIYNMSHTLMVPLATRNTRQRDSLAMLTSTGTSMIPGMLVTIIMPILVAKMGVGLSAQGNWAKVMSIISIFALPAVLVEYYFTKERVTEENISDDGENTMQIAAMKDQIKACVTNKYFWMVMAFWAIFQLTQNLQTNVMLYFCNWVLGSSVTQGATNQILVNAVGQAPLGFGIFILWPLIHKFGKRWVTQIGFVIAAVGCLIIFLNPHSLGTVLGGLNASGYISPASIGATSDTIINQPASTQSFIIWMFVGVEMIGYLIISLIFTFYDLEAKIPQISADITARHKAEAEARGEVWISPEEKQAMEQEEQERKAEEKRIEELKEKCAKKGLDFDEEEAKYQAKLAEAKAKAEAKAAKKKKK